MKARQKSTAYHFPRRRLAETAIKKIQQEGLIPGKGFKSQQAIEKRVRRIFDEEKPKGINAKQTRAVFLWPDIGHPITTRSGVIEAKVGKQAIVADARIFSNAFFSAWALRHNHSTQIIGKPKNMQAALTPKGIESWIRQEARSYWSKCMTLEAFERFFEQKNGIWQRKTNAPAALPRIIEIPEILFPNRIPLSQIRTLPFEEYKARLRKA